MPFDNSQQGNPWMTGPLVELPKAGMGGANPNQQPGVPGPHQTGPLGMIANSAVAYGVNKQIDKAMSSTPTPPTPAPAPLGASVAPAIAEDAVVTEAAPAVMASLPELAETAILFANDGTPSVPNAPQQQQPNAGMMMAMATAAPWLAAGYMGGQAARAFSRGTPKIDMGNPSDPFGFAKGGFINPYMSFQKKHRPPIDPIQQPTSFNTGGGFQGMVSNTKSPLSVRAKGLPNLHSQMVRPGGEE